MVMPRQKLDEQQTQAAAKMRAQQQHEAAFGKLYQRLLGPAQEAVERFGALQGLRQRPEMQRQKERQ